MCICYAVWLAHKAADVWSEVDMLALRASEFADLVERIEVPERAFTAGLAERSHDLCRDRRCIRDVG